ncbi:MAG: CDP-diacylglycerol--glycerol-3-phosphate 3-phosphatidyltransferase [Methylococcales bacterium]|nr:CDP-diacylglycerol--glycerol-3-phosphate 3-phosphatidyltransferase [Methylococcales bacterium]
MAIELNLPIYLTLLRILLIPLLAILFYLPWEYARLSCTLVFVLAAITDWLDGYYARKLNMVSSFGAFLDPVADKLMVAVVLVLLVQDEASVPLAIASAIIIGREITIASLREWMAEIGQRGIVQVSQMGKWKTTLQMLALALLLYREDIAMLPVATIGYGMLYIAAVLTLWSMVSYLRAAWQTMNN